MLEYKCSNTEFNNVTNTSKQLRFRRRIARAN